jgi:hypothetical protein
MLGARRGLRVYTAEHDESEMEHDDCVGGEARDHG